MSFLKRLFSSAYDELWKAVIRPNRDKYFDFELGPEKFELKGKCYKRTDFTLRNKKNNKLVCSFWEPFDEEREYPKLPCVIYLHGNSSSRCEVVPEIKYLLKKGITVFAFDFSGCGRSEGEYISLGWHEQDDVACVVDFLRRSNKVSTIGLWGRSMGAATALMYSTKDLSIAGLVLDSPFSSLKSLINELAKDRVNLPDFVVKQAIKWRNVLFLRIFVILKKILLLIFIIVKICIIYMLEIKILFMLKEIIIQKGLFILGILLLNFFIKH